MKESISPLAAVFWLGSSKELAVSGKRGRDQVGAGAPVEVTIKEMPRWMPTSRAALDLLLDPDYDAVTLSSKELLTVLIKHRHNVASNAMDYPLKLPRIRHEYIILWQRRRTNAVARPNVSLVP